MARLTWDTPGTRYFETGVDRGVLYVGPIGVAWSGLISVTEKPTGGEPRPFYIDGFKYLNLASAEEYEAEISCFSSPAEFAQCDGRALIQNGLYATAQPRKEFGFSYRTKVGNDIDGSDHGYRIHVVYNALAAPTERSYNTLSDSVDPNQLSWSITTRPPRMSSMKPTAHFVIDTRYTPSEVLDNFERVLYGDDTLSAYLPTVEDLLEIFSSFMLLRIVEIEPNVWQIEEVERADARSMKQPFKPDAASDPILWLDTSATDGEYAVPRLVPGA